MMATGENQETERARTRLSALIGAVERVLRSGTGPYVSNELAKDLFPQYEAMRVWLTSKFRDFVDHQDMPFLSSSRSGLIERDKLTKMSNILRYCLDLLPTAAPAAVTSAQSTPSPDPGMTAAIASLHPDISAGCRKLYEGGDYAEAVEKGFKIVREKLRALSGYETGAEAFGRGDLYIDGSAAPHVDGDFQEGVKFLTMAIDRFRNEKSHTADGNIRDPLRAYEYLRLSSLALHLLMHARRKPRGDHR